MSNHGLRDILAQKVRVDNLFRVLHLPPELVQILSKHPDDALLDARLAALIVFEALAGGLEQVLQVFRVQVAEHFSL